MAYKEQAPKVLPPKTSLSKFQEYISKARDICGFQNVRVVVENEELIDGHYMKPCDAHDMHAILDREYFVASAVICPREVPQVQGLMRLCNEYEIPVWTFSAGRNTGYGGIVCSPFYLAVPMLMCLFKALHHVFRVVFVSISGDI
jgi:hypothetical protein